MKYVLILFLFSCAGLFASPDKDTSSVREKELEPKDLAKKNKETRVPMIKYEPIVPKGEEYERKNSSP